MLIAAVLQLDQVVSAAAQRVRARELLVDEAAAQPAQFLFVVDPLGDRAPAVVCGAIGAAHSSMQCSQSQSMVQKQSTLPHSSHSKS
jgi:hypothetical protein